MEVESVAEQPPHLEPVKKIVLNDEEDFDSMNVRPEALFLRGVDELSPRNIKLYIDRYVKPDYSFANKDKYESLNYKIEWINDTSLNIVFNDLESATIALERLSLELKDTATDERPAKEYVNEPNEDKTAQLYVRLSFSYDKKIKNARVYSRYYLLNGEPESKDRPNDYYVNFKKNRYRERESRYARDEEPDLITGEVKPVKEAPPSKPLEERLGIRSRQNRRRRNRDDEEDLFPNFVSRRSRSRSRSPTRDEMEVDN